jgi:acyl-CoA thioester hydrolase
MNKKLVHVERIAIRWGDMDAMGYVNNTIYFRYMEQARISWFDAQGRSVPLPDRIRQIIDG